jgi:hypothetical protein
MAHRSVKRGAERADSAQGAQRHISAEERARWSALQRMIPSSVWEAAYAEGRAEGGLAVVRDLCREQVRRHHPALRALGP